MELPWLLVGGLACVLIVLITFGWWRSTGVGPQVQVPMFYDAHYLFPRPWTQEQAAPGVPEPAPLAFFGSNRISQSFLSGSDQLSMIEIWLAGEENEEVSVFLEDDQGAVLGEDIQLRAGAQGGYYRLSFEPIQAAKNRRFTLILNAANATRENPVITRTVGGDRLGGSININEYNRPGNLALAAYASGLPGFWWLEAIKEQVLPSLFGLRLQQYKPPFFKGLFFPLLLMITAGLSVVYLVLARPQADPSLSHLRHAIGWTLAIILALFIVWQLAAGRMKVRPFADDITLHSLGNTVDKAPPPGASPRLMRDLAADLWTAERLPEERFVSSELFEGLPAIRVPAHSQLEYRINVPPNARFRVGFAGNGEGTLQAKVNIGGQEVQVEDVTGHPVPGIADVHWITLDLAPWAGQPVSLKLISEGENDGLGGLWIMPQIETDAGWLLPDPPPSVLEIEEVSYRFGDAVELIGYERLPAELRRGESALIRLYWRPLHESSAYAKVFVHIIDEQGQLVAQHDAQPVNDTYPIPIWQPGTIVLDEHTLQIPADLPAGAYTVAVGMYDPDSLERWPVAGPDGQLIPERRVVLSTAVEVSP